MNKQTEQEQHQMLAPRFQGAGYSFLYGGGSDSKGHGYWLQEVRSGVRTGYLPYSQAFKIVVESEIQAGKIAARNT